jgi:catechol 2,3-dioxygenase-like lactoylglutathione lyase family enzyme
VAQASPAKVTCKKINQIAIVVKDLELVAENYWKILGIGPWTIFDWEAPFIYDRKYHGKPARAREKLAVTQVGDVQLELLQPLEGPSIYADWIEEHGEGLHHLNFLVNDADEIAGLLEAEGFRCLQSGRYGPAERQGTFTYFDIKPLAAIWEPVHVGDKAGTVPKIFPPKGEASPAKVTCKKINQIGIVVKDLELVAENYWNILGIGPWRIFNWEAPFIYDRKYHGKPVCAREKIALAQVGDVQLELLQPVEGPSIYADWIEEHGEGLHHLNFLVNDVDEIAGQLEAEGFRSMQSGRYGPADRQGSFTYFDIKPLAAIWEPVHVGDKAGAVPTIIPKA